MTNKNTKKILEEIYKLEPELKKQEKDLIKVISKLTEAKPHIKVDKKFADKLKKELMVEAGQNSEHNFLISLLSGKWVLAPAGLAVLLMILAFSSLYYLESNNNVKLSNSGDDEFTRIASLPKEAFGKLNIKTEKASSEEDLGVQGGGQLTKREAEAVDGRGEGSADTSASNSGIVPNRINYEFLYKGEDFQLSKSEMPVYKKVVDDTFGNALRGQLQGLDLDLINLAKLDDLAVNNISLVQDKDLGYNISINFRNGSVSINKNWQKWPSAKMDCSDQKCFEKQKVKIEDVPENGKLIEIADAFVKRMEIDMSVYGEPIVEDSWKDSYKKSENKENYYIPDNMSVIYPLQIEGKKVYQEGGSPTGLMINVDIKRNKVSGVRNLYASHFQGSEYSIVNKQEKILSYAKDGGIRSPFEHSEPTETVTVELGTPELKLVQVWNYNEKNRQSDELYIPAYVFPVENVSKETYFTQKNIVVPIIKNFMKKQPPPVIGIPEMKR